MAITVRTTDSAALRDYANVPPVRRRHTLTIVNPVSYAEDLHNRHGYYVINEDDARERVGQWIRELIESGQPLTNETVAMALDGAGFEATSFLRSYTNEMRPPVRPGQGPRQAHPGGWADITNNLRNGYFHLVNGRRGGGSYSEP